MTDQKVLSEISELLSKQHSFRLGKKYRFDEHEFICCEKKINYQEYEYSKPQVKGFGVKLISASKYKTFISFEYDLWGKILDYHFTITC